VNVFLRYILLIRRHEQKYSEIIALIRHRNLVVVVTSCLGNPFPSSNRWSQEWKCSCIRLRQVTELHLLHERLSTIRVFENRDYEDYLLQEIWSFHQCNTFTSYFLLIVDMFWPHTAIFKCYSILSRSWCSVMPIFAYVMLPAMCFSWCCVYCQCPFVRIFVLSLWPPCCLLSVKRM
jgi:hypothetical protein